MTAAITIEDIERTSRAFITAQKTNLGVEVTTTVIYPDGEPVTVVVADEGTGQIVHDAGFGAMNLAANGITINRALTRKLAHLANQYGCEFTGTRMQRRCSVDQVPVAIVMVANASRAIGDQIFEVRATKERDFRLLVAERVHEIGGARIRDNEEVQGKHRSYRMPHSVLDSAQSRVVAYILPVASRGTVLSHVGELYDIRGAQPDIRAESVVDESSDIRDEDVQLLQEFGPVTPFTRVPIRITELLKAA